MHCIDKSNKIYSISLQNLTYGQVKKLTSNSDMKLGSLLMFYDKETDLIYIIEGDNFTMTLNCINKALVLSEEEIESLVKKLKVGGNRLIFEVMLGVIKTRGARKYQEVIKTSESPNSKFISLGDSIIQINKIISVKKHGDTAIDILTTGRNTSVRKTYTTRKIRDCELQKIEKILLQTA